MRQAKRSQAPGKAIPPDAAYQSSVADRVARLNVVLKRQMGAFAKEMFELTIVETRLILMLKMFGPTSVNELALRSDIDRTQISKSVAALAGRNIALRTTGAEDRRETLLSLSRQGLAVHDRILAELYRRNEALIEGISPSALESFFAVMELLIIKARAQSDSAG